MYRRWYRNRVTRNVVTGMINIRSKTVLVSSKKYDAEEFFLAYIPISKKEYWKQVRDDRVLS